VSGDHAERQARSGGIVRLICVTRRLTWPVKLTGVLGRCAVLGRVRIAGLMGLSMDGPAAYLWALGHLRSLTVIRSPPGRLRGHAGTSSAIARSHDPLSACEIGAARVARLICPFDASVSR